MPDIFWILKASAVYLIRTVSAYYKPIIFINSGTAVGKKKNIGYTEINTIFNRSHNFSIEHGDCLKIHLTGFAKSLLVS